MTNKRDVGVVGPVRRCRRRYDADTKRALIEAALRPGASVAGLAQEHGINANLLRKWISRYLLQREAQIGQSNRPRTIEMIDGVSTEESAKRTRSTEAAFVPVVAPSSRSEPMTAMPTAVLALTLGLQVRLPNGVELEVGQASLDEASKLIQMLGRLPCSGSTMR